MEIDKLDKTKGNQWKKRYSPEVVSFTKGSPTCIWMFIMCPKHEKDIASQMYQFPTATKSPGLKPGLKYRLTNYMA